MFTVFLLSYRNTRESLGELKKAVETLACGSCSHSISHPPKLPLMFLWLDRNTVHVFYFLKKEQINLNKTGLGSFHLNSCRESQDQILNFT